MNSLEKSIKKWEDIASGTGVDNGAQNCALCMEFFNNAQCYECPVYEKTGIDECDNTPYEEWVIHHETVHESDDVPNDTRAICPKCVEIAEKEVKFLKSLKWRKNRSFQNERKRIKRNAMWMGRGSEIP